MIEPQITANFEQGMERARLRVSRAVYDSANASIDQGPRAHRARLERHEDRRSLQAPVPKLGRGGAQRE